MVDAELPTLRIVAQVVQSPFTRLPLYRGEPDNVIGVLHAKAVLRQVHQHGGRIDDIDVPALAAKPWLPNILLLPAVQCPESYPAFPRH